MDEDLLKKIKYREVKIMKKSKIYEYKGYNIQNIPLKSEARWFIFDENMNKIVFSPEKTLKDAKSCIDDIIKSKE